ncbi:MAG: hypothetical protein LBU60_06615, partial [Clostridiales bacterium]|nr:hypothetical protein [Clostridiales bacterium]
SSIKDKFVKLIKAVLQTFIKKQNKECQRSENQQENNLAQKQIDDQQQSQVGVGTQLQNQNTVHTEDSDKQDNEQKFLIDNFDIQDDFLLQKLEDSDFIEQCILNNSSIVSKVVQNYIAQIQSTPSIITLSNRLGSAAMTPYKQPKTLTDAKKIADELFDI